MRYSISLLALLVAVSTASAQQEPRKPIPATEAQLAARQEKIRLAALAEARWALTQGAITLREAVRRAGGSLSFTVTPNEDDVRADDVAALVSKSRLVVIGRPSGKPTARIASDGRGIVTHYQVQVDRVVRVGTIRDQQLAPPLTISVDVPGGKLTFPEGTAEAPPYLELTSSQQYVLFLQRPEDVPSYEDANPVFASAVKARLAAAEPTFVITGQHYEGLFRVEDSRVRSLAAVTSRHLKQRYDGRNVSEFLTEVRTVR